MYYVNYLLNQKLFEIIISWEIFSHEDHYTALIPRDGFMSVSLKVFESSML